MHSNNHKKTFAAVAAALIASLAAMTARSAIVWDAKTALKVDRITPAECEVAANFSKQPRSAEFSFDGAKLGFDGAKAAWTRPAIAGVQKGSPAPDFSKPVEVPAGGGFVLVAP